jgi:hypothetical protein
MTHATVGISLQDDLELRAIVLPSNRPGDIGCLKFNDDIFMHGTLATYRKFAELILSALPDGKDQVSKVSEPTTESAQAENVEL